MLLMYSLNIKGMNFSQKKRHTDTEEKKAEKEEVASEATASEVAAPSRDTMTLRAIRDTQLADGTFVKAGTIVEVSKSYAEQVLKETPCHFSYT